MSTCDFKPKVSSSLPRGFRSVKLNFANNDGDNKANHNQQSVSESIDINNNQITSQSSQAPSTRSRSPNQTNASKHAGNRYGLYNKQSDSNAPEVIRHMAPANSPPPPPVPPPPSVTLNGIPVSQTKNNGDAPIYLQPYEVPPEAALATSTSSVNGNVKPFWTLPEVEQRAVLQQLSRSPSPVAGIQSVEPEQIEHVITDQNPPPNAQFLYETDSHRFYSVPTGSKVQKIVQDSHVTQTVCPDGIGPVNESGVPVALRTGVKDEYASDWYKTMFKTLHKAEKPKWLEEEPVTVKIPKRKSPKKDFKLDSYNEDGRRSKNEHLTDKYTEANQYRRYQEEERRKKDLHKDSVFLADEPTKYVIKKKKSQKSKSPVPKKTYASVQRGEEIPLSGLSKPAPIYRPRGFYEQKQQEQILFTPTQSPVPPHPNPNCAAPCPTYDLNVSKCVEPSRALSPSQYNQTTVSTSPGFSLHSIDEWQRRQDEDLNQIYCTIRRNHEVNRLKESGRLVSPQPEPRSRSSHQLYQSELLSSSAPRPTYQPHSQTAAVTPNTGSHPNHYDPPLIKHGSVPDAMHAHAPYQPVQTRSSSLVATNGDTTTHSLQSVQTIQSRSSLTSNAPIPPARPMNSLRNASIDMITNEINQLNQLNQVNQVNQVNQINQSSQSSQIASPYELAPPTSGLTLYASPTKKRTLIEQTYYDRERFDQPELVQPVSLDRKWSEARLDSDWSTLDAAQQQIEKAQSDIGHGIKTLTGKPLPAQNRLHSYNTIGRTNVSNQNHFDSLGLRSSASLGNLHIPNCSSPNSSAFGNNHLQASKGHSISLAEDVNNVSFSQPEEEDDLDKLIKKIEQDAIIQDELDNYNTTQIYQTPVLNKYDPNFRNDLNRNRFLLQKHYEHDPNKNRTEDFDLPRRHHYSPNPDSVVHLNRFEQAYREKEGSEIRHKVFAKVLRDFRASRDNEISVQRGDIVIISRQIDQNWVEIEDTQSGLKGFVPRKYLDFEQEGMATAKFDFNGRSINNELSLRKGESVKVIRQVDENWFKGVNSRGEMGIFPCSYVEMLKKPLTEELHISLVPGVESPVPTYSPAHLSPQPCSVTRTLPANTVKQAVLDHNSAVNGRPGRHTKTYRVMFNYSPQQADELQLIAGDLVEVSLECDDGWYVGRSSLTGKTGMFPGNYVERLP